MQITSEKALFDISSLNAESKEWTFDNEAVKLLNLGLPAELVTRLEAIWGTIKVIGNETVAVGKIIVKKIVDFMLNNSGMTVGLLFGAAVAAFLSASIPFVGALLAPLIVTLSALYGYNIQDGGKDSLLYSAVKLAKEFLDLVISIFQAVTSYVRD